ncbi:MAG TPA: hypothetical protein VHS74_02920 [Solirubrobacterales bacterium]|jgi:hypothetical protein|nr:hypothetical protein [Solirubrobacterales bacterium]
MTDDWKVDRPDGRLEELDNRIRRVENYLSGRERYWAKVSERAFLAGAMVSATVAAVVIAERRGQLR